MHAARCAWLGLCLAACAGSPPPADVFHRLPVAPPAVRGAPLLPGTVEVARLEASDVLRGRALVVAQADRPGRLQPSSYHYWTDAPAVLVQQGLAAHLREGAVAERVVVPQLRDDPSWVVSGRIERFERITGGGGGRVAVAMELALHEREARALRTHGRYEVSEAAADGSAEAAVDAFGRAVAAIFEAFLADVEAAQPAAAAATP